VVLPSSPWTFCLATEECSTARARRDKEKNINLYEKDFYIFMKYCMKINNLDEFFSTA